VGADLIKPSNQQHNLEVGNQKKITGCRKILPIAAVIHWKDTNSGKKIQTPLAMLESMQ
jgi:hypothetical protein